jgi:hypothetical protein
VRHTKPIASLVSVVLLSLGMATLATSTASADSTPSPSLSTQGNGGGNDDPKVWVCKYVGTPGVNETLKPGNDGLVHVSANTLSDQTVAVGASFPDAQGRSLVVQIGGSRPDASICPGYVAPTISGWYTWKTPNYAPHATTLAEVGLPQTYVGAGKLTPSDCSTTYQQDYYVGTAAAIAAILADNQLTGTLSHPEDASVVRDWNFVSSAACVTPTKVTAVFPEPTPATCTSDGALPALPTDQTGITFSWSSDNHLRMMATALKGYVLTGYTSRTYTEPGGATGDCYVPLEPVTVAPATCQVGDGGVGDVTGGSITLPTTAGVTYTVAGGETTGLAAGDYVVTATPAEGKILSVGETAWALQEDGRATITVTIDPATNCSVPQPDPKVTATEWVDGTWTCDATTVTQTREVTTTPYVWVDGEWVLDNENATTVTETRTRDLLPGEQTVCAEVLAAPPNASLTIVPPTCTADGSATLVNGENYTWDKTSFGPGQWTATATAADGYTFDKGNTYQVTFLVSPKLTGSACTLSEVLAAPPNASVTTASSAVLAATGATPLPLAIIALVLIGAGVVLQPRVRQAIFGRH